MTSRQLSLRISALAGMLCLFCAPAPSQVLSQNQIQTMENHQNAKEEAGKDFDKAFVKKTLECGMSEIEASQLALQKSSDDQVKVLARQLIDDHAKLADAMAPVASKAGVKQPKEPSKDDRKMIAQLQTLSGPDFDTAYIKYMLRSYQGNASAFKQEMFSGQIPQVRQFASQDDSIVETHLQMVEGVAQGLNISM
jgi:putative membrane protein